MTIDFVLGLPQIVRKFDDIFNVVDRFCSRIAPDFISYQKTSDALHVVYMFF